MDASENDLAEIVSDLRMCLDHYGLFAEERQPSFSLEKRIRPQLASRRWDQLVSVRRDITAWAGMIGSALFVGVFTIDGYFRPGYDQFREYVSALSIGPRGWIQICEFRRCRAVASRVCARRQCRVAASVLVVRVRAAIPPRGSRSVTGSTLRSAQGLY